MDYILTSDPLADLPGGLAVPEVIHGDLIEWPDRDDAGRWLVQRCRDIRPRHAGITDLVGRMVFRLGIDILGLVDVVLKRRQGPDRVPACGKEIDHGSSVFPNES